MIDSLDRRGGAEEVSPTVIDGYPRDCSPTDAPATIVHLMFLC
jgi:hypothetical protein